jgi:hypothetical protein
MTLTDHDIICLEAAKAMIDRDRQQHHSIEAIATGLIQPSVCGGLYRFLKPLQDKVW